MFSARRAVLPTVRGIPGPYRFFFYSFDCGEPMHVHVERERCVCKFWIEPIMLVSNSGFRRHDLNQIRRLIASNIPHIVEAWEEHCG